MTETALHQPVFLTQAVDGLAVQNEHWYLDATYGRGGHTREIIKRGGRVIAFDVDQEAIEFGQTHDHALIENGQLILIHANFDHLSEALYQLPDRVISGVLFDFGTSVDQLLSETRGFSFESDAPLDMRMDQRLGVTAEDMLRVLTEKQLADAFRDLGGETESKAVARALKKYRAMHQKVTAREIADTIVKAKHQPRTKIHPATKVFQALRILVNMELDAISIALPQAIAAVQPPARIVTIAFHEGEDRLAKHAFADWERQDKGYRLPKEALAPSQEEQERNPRSRSAKLRIFVVC